MRGIRTDFDGTESDHGTVNFIDNAIDFLEIVGVGDDLVTGDNVLLGTRMLAGDPPHLVPTSSDEAQFEALRSCAGSPRPQEAKSTDLVNDHGCGISV